MPESTCNSCPVIELDLSDIKNSTVLATDVKLVKLFNDVLFFIFSFKSPSSVELISVSIKPLTTQFERMPLTPHSLDVFLEKAYKAPFVAAYIDNPLYPVCTLILDMCTIEPPVLCNNIFLIAYFVKIIGE